MGPLQYMVMSYNKNYFRDEIIPELSSLSRRGVIRVIDLLFVRRDARGAVTSQELKEVLPDEVKLIDAPDDSTAQWFAQDDIDVVGECLPLNTSVALLLFEHAWATRLDELVGEANDNLRERASASLISEIEQRLTMSVAA